MKIALFACSALALLSTTGASVAQPVENVTVELECYYPKEGGSRGTGRAYFSSSDGYETVQVTYLLRPEDIERELRQRAGVSYTQRSATHYASEGNVYIVRNIESAKGLIDNVCDEAISLLVGKILRKPPDDLRGHRDKELYLLNEIGRLGWQLTHKSVHDKSTDLQSNITEKFYFSRVSRQKAR